jgi:DNA-binding NtrC family response regulator
VSIHIPPLRERPADILPLAEHLLARLGAVHNRPGLQFSEKAKQALARYSWPGNIRELKNVIERALVFGKSKDGTFGVEDLPENIRTSASGNSMTVSRLKSLEDIEKDAIIATLEATHYKITKAAEILGISRKTLLDKRKRYGLE